MEITRQQIKEILEGINNPTWSGLTSLTPVDMNQYLNYWLIVDGQKKKNPNPTPNPYFEDGIMKFSKKYKINTGFDYEKSVTRRRTKEGIEEPFVGGFKNLIPLKDIFGKPMFRDVTDEDGITIIGREPIMVERLPWFEVISKGLVTDRKTHTKFYFRYQQMKDSEIGESIYYFNGNPIMEQLFKDYLTQKNNFYNNQGLENPLMFQVCDLNNIQRISINEEQYELIGTI
jgi:hypothetical protein